jgi:phenylacetate-CoA ligase
MSQMPAVRFATGDKVVRYPADYCACGRPFSGLLIGGTERYDDMMKIRGVNVWPSAVDAVVLANSAVAEYAARIFVDGAGREVLILGLQPSDDASPEKKDALERAVADAVREVTGLRAEVHIVETDLVGALSDFKVKRWVDLRSKGVGLSLADAIDDLAERKTRY